MKKYPATVNLILFFPLILIGASFFSCKDKQQKKIFKGAMKMYPLSPYVTIHDDRNPVEVTKFLIIEGNIKDMVKTKDTVLKYINGHTKELLCKKDTVTHFRIYEADAKFNHTYKQSHPYPIGIYDRNLILSLSYKEDSLYRLDYILHDDGKFFKHSKTPPPVRE